MFWTWLEEAFTKLPGCDDAIFKGLWLSRRLRFGNQTPDDLDEYSARLVCGSLRHCTRLFIVLPDSQSSRPSLLFATALIRAWYDSRIQQSDENGPHRQKVLYFGSAIGVRGQLSQVRIEGKDWELNLSEVFQQQNIGKKQQKVGKGKKPSKSQPITLPEVITVYSPVDPVAAVEQHSPQWIAIDCSDAESLRWLEPLLKTALERHIPILAWGQNPLSECVVEFARCGSVFTWPNQATSAFPPPSELKCKLEPYLCPDETTQIQPIVLEGASADRLVASLREANRLLASAFEVALGRFARDAIRVHWKYLRALESLSVPFEFYEAEASHFWGLKSLKQLSNECEHFREACKQSNVNLAARLEQVNTCLETATEHLQQSGSPLWKVLCGLVTEEPPTGECRLIVFTSGARKQLFLLALLAKHNRTEEDLHALRTWVFSLTELQALKCQDETSLDVSESLNLLKISRDLRWHPTVVGLPSPLLTPKLLPILLQQKVDFLLHGHQTFALARQVNQWAMRLKPDTSDIAAILGQLSGTEVPPDFPTASSRLDLTDLSALDAGNITKPKPLGVKPLWQPGDPVSEVARLLESDQTLIDDEISTKSLLQEDSETDMASEQESWCESAIQVCLENDWHVCFAPDDKINVIVTGEKGQQIDKRYVRALKSGDRVIAIPEQRRQSLYDLILSRVHGHPTIELHLALIRRWQQDFVSAYQRWRIHGVRNLDGLLWQMQQKGSNLTYSLTLRYWLSGDRLCPEDAEDLRRLAEILNMGFVQAHYLRIYQAAKRLRNLHRALSRRLNSWLEEQASGSVGENGDDVIDAELGITFNDFRNSLLILRVQDVQPITGLFLRSSLGRFERTNLE